MDIAYNNVKKHGFSSLIELRLGEGIEPIEKNECELVIIAGMGGKLIGDIIENDIEKAARNRAALYAEN